MRRHDEFDPHTMKTLTLMPSPHRPFAIRFVVLFLFVFSALISSCTSIVTTQFIDPAFENMGRQSDVELFCEGSPPYLLMIDSLAAGNPNKNFLIQGIKAYTGYINAYAECDGKPGRLQTLAEKPYHYVKKLMTAELSLDMNSSFDEFSHHVESLQISSAEPLFYSALGWATWVQQQNGAPVAMASLGKIEKMLIQVVNTDETVENGAAHFLLGAYYGSRPSLLGGDSEKSSYHFTRALELSQREVLIYQTIFAETYCRTFGHKDLHDALLQEVVDYPLESSPSNTLSNQLAKRKAHRLLADQFFQE